MRQGLITGIIDEDQVFLDFGDYEGRSLYEVSDKDPSFYNCLLEEKEKGNLLMKRDKYKLFKLTLINNKDFN